MTIDQKFDLWKSRHDDLLRWYRELRQLHYDATGVDYVPRELMDRDVTAITDADREWLKDMGIATDHLEQ